MWRLGLSLLSTHIKLSGQMGSLMEPKAKIIIIFQNDEQRSSVWPRGGQGPAGDVLPDSKKQESHISSICADRKSTCLSAAMNEKIVTLSLMSKLVASKRFSAVRELQTNQLRALSI